MLGIIVQFCGVGQYLPTSSSICGGSIELGLPFMSWDAVPGPFYDNKVTHPLHLFTIMIFKIS